MPQAHTYLQTGTPSRAISVDFTPSGQPVVACDDGCVRLLRPDLKRGNTPITASGVSAAGSGHTDSMHLASKRDRLLLHAYLVHANPKPNPEANHNLDLAIDLNLDVHPSCHPADGGEKRLTADRAHAQPHPHLKSERDPSTACAAARSDQRARS